MNRGGRLEGRVAVVTGASRGIGRAIAVAYAREGARVVVAARDTGALDEVVEEIGAEGGEAAAVRADVSRDTDVEALVAATVEAFGPATVLVNNAGTYAPGRFFDHDLESFRRVMEVNFFGLLRVTQAFLPGMVDRGYGKLVNVASTAGKYGSLYQSPYNSSKHAVIGLTRCLALEMAKTGVTVNAICPGFVDTPMVRDAAPALGAILGIEDPDRVVDALLTRVPLGRLLEPEEIAHLAVYLGSGESDGMTGQALTISGGLILV